MVYFTDAQTFFEQSKLLLQARPSTTKISTKYTLPKPTAKLAKSLARRRTRAPGSTTAAATTTTTTTATTEDATATAQPKAVLTLRTYDPVSGTVLKYQTDKQAEVGRLVAGLGRCARVMAAMPDEAEGAGEQGLEGAEGAAGAGPAGASAAAAVGVGVVEGTAGQGQGQAGKGSGGGGGGGGGKKKKKNKK